jgi:predicted metal-dependent hydrolase
MAWLLTRGAAAPPATSRVTLSSLIDAIGDAQIAERIAVRVSPKARRVSLRIDAGSGGVVLVHPRRMSLSAILAFVAEKRDWIAEHLAALPPHVAFVDGAVIPLRGVDHMVRFAPEQRGGVWAEDGVIVVTGRVEHAKRRLTDWLKAQARSAISPLAHGLAEKVGRGVAHVTVRDTTSRWGSCTRSGRLSFSWRLILAPENVLRYVVAHEVAHLKHMDHSPAFWRTVDVVLAEENVSVDAALARDWLRRHGAVLHRYG